MKISGKMGLMITLKVPKNQAFALPLEDTFFEKPKKEVKLTPPAVLGLRMQKSVVESCLDKKFLDILSFLKRCCSSLLRLFMALRKSFLRNDEASVFETFGSLNIRNFGYTLSCLQLLRQSMSNFSLFFLYSSFLYLPKSLTVTFAYFCAKPLQLFIILLDSTKLKIVCKK